MLLFGNGDFQEAFHLLEYTTNARPYDAGARYNFGRVLKALGREEEARSHLEATEALQYLDQEIEQARAAAARYPDDPARWQALAVARVASRKAAEQAESTGLSASP